MIKKLTPQAAREAAGLSKEELRQKIPCALVTIYSAENAKRFPRAKALRAAYLAALNLVEVDGKIVPKSTPVEPTPVQKAV